MDESVRVDVALSTCSDQSMILTNEMRESLTLFHSPAEILRALR
jgi:hypothetical protein